MFYLHTNILINRYLKNYLIYIFGKYVYNTLSEFQVNIQIIISYVILKITFNIVLRILYHFGI